MSTTSNNTTPWLIAVILGLLLIISIGYSCFQKRTIPKAGLTVITDTIPGDSVPYAVTLPKPSPLIVYQDTGRSYWGYRKVDTTAILAEYNSCKAYKDTLKNDSSALIVLLDSVKWNALQSRRLLFQNRRPTIVTMPLPPGDQSKYSFLIGAAIGRNQHEFGLMPTLACLDNKGIMYSLSYDLVQKDIYIGALWKIQRKIKIP